jgi:hypothetical protein
MHVEIPFASVLDPDRLWDRYISVRSSVWQPRLGPVGHSWTFGETTWFMQVQTICVSAVGVQSGRKPAVSRLSYRSETTCMMQEHDREWTNKHNGIEALVCFAEPFRGRGDISVERNVHAIPLHSKPFLKLRGRDLGKHHSPNNENEIILSEALCPEALCAL